jgi:hypothetical protein
VERAREFAMTDSNSDYQPTTHTTHRTNDSNGTNRTNDVNGTNDVLTAQNLGFDPHTLANDMIKVGWFGDSMWEPETAEEYILMAGANPNIANELPPAGLKFWRAAKFRFEADMARKKFNRPPRKTVPRDPT